MNLILCPDKFIDRFSWREARGWFSQIACRVNWNDSRDDVGTAAGRATDMTLTRGRRARCRSPSPSPSSSSSWSSSCPPRGRDYVPVWRVGVLLRMRCSDWSSEAARPLSSHSYWCMKLSGRVEGLNHVAALLARSPVARRSASWTVARRRNGNGPPDAPERHSCRPRDAVSRGRDEFTAASRVKEPYFHGGTARRKRPPLGAWSILGRKLAPPSRDWRSKMREKASRTRSESAGNIENPPAYVDANYRSRMVGVFRDVIQKWTLPIDPNGPIMAKLSRLAKLTGTFKAKFSNNN